MVNPALRLCPVSRLKTVPHHSLLYSSFGFVLSSNYDMFSFFSLSLLPLTLPWVQRWATVHSLHSFAPFSPPSPLCSFPWPHIRIIASTTDLRSALPSMMSIFLASLFELHILKYDLSHGHTESILIITTTIILTVDHGRGAR